MGMPHAPLTLRQRLIVELEQLGFNEFGKQDWRDASTMAELFEAVGQMTGEPVGYPDVSEMEAAIRESVAAQDAFIAASTDPLLTNMTFAWNRRDQALSDLRDLLAQIDLAMEDTDAR